MDHSLRVLKLCIGFLLLSHFFTVKQSAHSDDEAHKIDTLNRAIKYLPAENITSSIAGVVYLADGTRKECVILSLSSQWVRLELPQSTSLYAASDIRGARTSKGLYLYRTEANKFVLLTDKDFFSTFEQKFISSTKVAAIKDNRERPPADKSRIEVIRSKGDGRKNLACTYNITVNGNLVGSVESGEDKEFAFTPAADGKNTVQTDIATVFGFNITGSKSYSFEAFPGSLTKIEFTDHPHPGLFDEVLFLDLTTIKSGKRPGVSAVDLANHIKNDDQMAPAGNAELTVLVIREANSIPGRTVWPQKIYLNDRYIGSVSNGTRMRFRVPADHSRPAVDRQKNNYTVSVKMNDYDPGVKKDCIASAGDEIVVKTGMDFISYRPSTIRRIDVHPAGIAKLRVASPFGPERFVLEINGRRWNVDDSKIFETSDSAATTRLIRLSIKTVGHGSLHDQVAFARPGKTLVVGMDRWGIGKDPKVLASIAYLMQLRGCVIYHVTDRDDNTGLSLEWLEKDLDALDSRGTLPELRGLKDSYKQYFRELDKRVKSGADGAIRDGLIAAAFECGLEALITRSVPTRTNVLTQTIAAVIGPGFGVLKVNSEFGEATARLEDAEDRVVNMLRDLLAEDSQLLKHPAVDEILAE